MGWAAMSNKMPGCHLANAWRSRSKHILQWRYYTAMKYQFIHSFMMMNESKWWNHRHKHKSYVLERNNNLFISEELKEIVMKGMVATRVQNSVDVRAGVKSQFQEFCERHAVCLGRHWRVWSLLTNEHILTNWYWRNYLFAWKWMRTSKV